LKKVNKTPPPDVLTQYVNQHPDDTWEKFKGRSNSRYKQIKEIIFTDQGHLCAYCEKTLAGLSQDKKQIEHYHSKSDNDNASINLHLDWNNLIGVCSGGKDTKKTHALSENLSCDSHKARLENSNMLEIPCHGVVLNPLDIIATPILFDFEKSTGKLVVNSEACEIYIPETNKFPNVVELVNNTIEVFNLNCDRLTDERLKIFRHYQNCLKDARNINNKNIYVELAVSWFSKKWPSYFTTRRLILGDFAERYLFESNYDG